MYAGHSSEDGRIQPLAKHLHRVAELAEGFAECFGAKELAHLIGICHDIGKYSVAFQNRILRNGPKVDHSTAGGQEIKELAGAPFAYCVLGHHGGLPDGGSPADSGGASTLYGRLKKQIPDYSAFVSEIDLKPPAEPEISPLEGIGFSISVLIRMLFSCLVDADFLDTEAFMSGGTVQRGGYEDIGVLHHKLMQFIQQFQQPTGELNRKRSEILENCLTKAENAPGLFTLTVPTGGGKTVSSLAFALAHAKKHGMDRVIYVIPYTSIIEQNAAVFVGIVGEDNVLEHHSSFDYDNTDEKSNRKYLSTENWDAPIVVTTNVQFFESLFASKTSRCRKLHNIANSVIIFDEAQMIPIPYLLACTRMIADLVHNFRCTAVLCSATQPALNAFFPPQVKSQEICDDPAELYEFFRRTSVKQLGQLTDQELAIRLCDQKQVLCIVNTRKQAQALYGLLQEGEGSFHLSTLLYPEHRKEILAKIRTRLKNELPCRVVATSLIEAGVDVDFPTVYRAQAGLDSIIQAAGRCNREGKQNFAESVVYVFDPDESYFRPLSQAQPIEVFSIIAQKYKDVASLEAIQAYFETLYQIKGEELDKKRIVPRLEQGWRNGGSFPFATIAKEFKFIETQTRTVLIPICPEAADYAQRLRDGERSRKLLRNVGRFSVNVYEHHFISLVQMGIVEIVDEEISILAELGSYHKSTGLTLSPEGGNAIFVDI